MPEVEQSAPWLPPGLTVVRQIGRGAGAQVYLCRDSLRDELVSLKTSDERDEPGAKETLAKEFRILAGVSCPGLPTALDFGSIGPHVHYTYRHVPGESLRRRSGAPSEEEFDDVAAGLFGALFVLHELGWIHYDVSPENVLVEPGAGWAGVRLIDLGHAGATGLTLTGTPGYIAPEILKGEPGGPESDLYSAGVTLAEFAIGERLFAGSKQRVVLSDRAPPLHGLEERLAERIGGRRSGLLLSLLQRRREARENDAFRCLELLGRFSGHRFDDLVESAVASVTGSAEAVGQALARPADRIIERALQEEGRTPGPVAVIRSRSEERLNRAVTSIVHRAVSRGLDVRRFPNRGDQSGLLLLGRYEVDDLERLSACECGSAELCATVVALVPPDLDPIVVQADGFPLPDLRDSLEGMNVEAGSAMSLAEALHPEVETGHFRLARFLAWMVREGHLKRSARSWLLCALREDWLANGLDQEGLRREAAGLEPGPLLDLAVAAAYPDEAAQDFVSAKLADSLRTPTDLLVHQGGGRRRFRSPATAAAIRAAAGPEELRSSHARIAELLAEAPGAECAEARTYHLLESGVVDAGTVGVLRSILEEGRLRAAREFGEAVCALDDPGSELLLLAAWLSVEGDDWRGCAAILERFPEEADAEVDFLRGLLAVRTGDDDLPELSEDTLPGLALASAAGAEWEAEELLARLEGILGIGGDTGWAGRTQAAARAVADRPFLDRYSVLQILDAVAHRNVRAERIDEASEIVAALAEVAREWGLGLWELRLRGKVGFCLVKKGDDAAGPLLEEVAREREALGDAYGASRVWANVALIQFQQEDLDGALRSWERLASLVRKAGDSRMLPAVLWRHACALQELGAWRSARLELEAAVRMATALGDLRNEALARLNLCILLTGEGSLATARRELQELRRRLEDTEEETAFKPDIERISARIAIASGAPIWDRQQTAKVIEEPETEEAELLPHVDHQERIALALQNALLAGYDLSGSPALGQAIEDYPENRVIRLLAMQSALPLEREVEEVLIGLVEELRKEAVDSEVALSTEVLLDMAIQLEGYGFRSPGHLIEHATDLAKKSGLPGLLWRASLAAGLKALRGGDKRSAIRGLGRALEGFAACHLGKGREVPPPVRRLPAFQAVVQAIEKLLSDLRIEPDPDSPFRMEGRVSIQKLQLCLSELALEVGGSGVQTEGKWARGIERILSVTETLNSTRELDRLLAQIVDSVLDLSDAEHGFVVLTDESGEPAVRVARGMFGEAEDIEGRVSQTVVKRVLAGRRALLIKNALDELDLVAQPSVRSLSLRSIMCAPLAHKGELFGVIFVDNRSAVGSFNEEDLRLLEVFANHAAIAIVNSRLVEDLERSNLELAEANEGILRSEKLKSLGVLAGGIAHDFNNLLMGVLGNADLALEHLSANARATRYARAIKKEAQRAADLCRELLAYSGKGQFVIEPIDLSEVVEDMTELLRLSIAKKAVVTYRLDEGLPAVEADVTQIRQIILNLVINASDSLEGNEGEITVATGVHDCDRDYLRNTYLGERLPEGSYVYFEVADTGCGLDDEAQSRLFEPFFTTKFTGRGLGLSAVLGIVRGHQGTIEVSSRPGAGTTMRVLFPCSARAALSSGGAEEEPRGDLGGGTVLVVDDESSVREIASEMVRTLGFRVVTAADGRGALEEYESRADEIVLVLLDMTMPRMSGEEAFREIQKIRGDARVILSSGYNEQESVQRLTADGLTGFLQKPYSLADLRRVIAKALNGQD